MFIENETAGQDSSNKLAELTLSLYQHLGLEPSLLNLLAMIVLAISAKAAIVFQAMRYVSYVAADVARDMRMQLIRALMKARWAYFTGLSVGKIANTISSEAQRAGHCYMLAGRTMAALVQLLVYLTAAFIVSWQVSLAAFLMGGVAAFCVKGFLKMARKAGEDMTSTMNDMLARLNESLSAVKPLKAMGQEDRYIQHLDGDTAKAMVAQKKAALSSLLMQIVYEPMAVILLALGLFYVLSFTETPPASVILLAFLFYRLMTNAQLLQGFLQNMIQNISAIWGMQNEIQKARDIKEIMPGGAKPSLENEIIFDGISVSYDEERKVLDNFSACVPAKEFTVFFGPSGVGKTTLVDALLSLVPLNAGTISIDGQALF